MTDEMKTCTLLPSGTIRTPAARASFVYLLKPQEPNARNQLKAPKHSITLLFPKDADLTLLQKMALDAARAKFGAKMDDPEFVKRLRNPFRDQGEKSFDGYVAGCKFIIATSDAAHRPLVVDQMKADITEERMIYPGCWVRATVNAFAYDTAGNRGVSFGIQGVQKVRDDEPLGGTIASADDFEAVEGTGPNLGGAAGAVFGASTPAANANPFG